MNYSKHKAKHKIEVLQKTLRWAESVRRGLVKIRAEEHDTGNYTIGEHDRSKKPTKKLHLVLKPSEGDAEGPEGTVKDIEGEAWIENEKKAVVIFR
ncbi:hypothetical protein [Parerythrobacter jejuensis]|uniref:Uncharacterized protein n=1 Tax=Parerythrobacter jejuensis TaxID=795812 RepID=A0A845ASX0_9SPHN|nr:hypothetical protein [Parerythrobacter jejuensis]MXP32694.1 hypothetical protein [Parerythrobacter jejuensis]